MGGPRTSTSTGTSAGTETDVGAAETPGAGSEVRGTAAGGARPAPRAALSGQTWREVAHLLSNVLVDSLFSFLLAVCVVAGLVLSLTVVGLPLLALTLLGCRWLGKAERWRARGLLRVSVEEPSPLRWQERGVVGWLRAQLRDSVGWRHALYFGVRLPWAWFTFLTTLAALLALWPALPWLARWLSNIDRMLVRTLLSPSDELERRVAELESDRGVVVDTAAADLRRIERDLHDGAQARLVTLAMGLGLAKEKLLEDPQAAASMVGEAHGEVKLVLEELRDLARGIHPAILTDRGLGPALSALGSRCTVPVTVRAELGARPAEAIEGIVYFTVSELLQNVSKHSGASSAEVDVWRSGSRVLVRVRDDGRGGAATSPKTHGGAPAGDAGTGGGTGLTGLTERLHAVDGVLRVSSPVGGPTAVSAELPWRDRESGRPQGHGR